MGIVRGTWCKEQTKRLTELQGDLQWTLNS